MMSGIRFFFLIVKYEINMIWMISFSILVLALIREDPF